MRKQKPSAEAGAFLLLNIAGCSERYLIERGDEPDSRHIHLVQASIVCDEEIDAKMDTGQLDRVGIANCR